MEVQSCISDLITAVLYCYYPATTPVLPTGVKKPSNPIRSIFDPLLKIMQSVPTYFFERYLKK